jgi:hypothetical protein
VISARGDKKLALARLRFGSQHKTHYFSTLRTGLLLGFAVFALMDGIRIGMWLACICAAKLIHFFLTSFSHQT